MFDYKMLARENARQVMARVIDCDKIVHTEINPFCSDQSCPCHTDREMVNALNAQVEQGLLTTVEANIIMRGATI